MRKRLIIIIGSFVALFATAWLEFFLQRNHQLIGAGINRTFLFLLINLHVLLLGFLLYIIIRQSIKLFLERKKGIPGSVFKRNLLFAFTFFSVIPSFFVFFTAGRLIMRNIDDWFQARIETGLKKGMLLHKKHVEQERQLLQREGRALLAGLSFGQASWMEQLRERIADRLNKDASGSCAYVWGIYGQEFVGSVKDEIRVWRKYRQFNDRTTQSLREHFFQQLDVIEEEGLYDFYGSLYWVKRIDDYWVILVKRYPPDIRYPLIELQNAVFDYEQLKSMRNPIFVSYFLTFILVTILILFLSIWCAFYLARGITKPIQELLDATAQIRKGRWDVQLPCQSSDDLRTLVEGFNEMIHAIQEARTQLEHKHNELFMILENLKAAVFLVGTYGRIEMCNASACSMVFRFVGIEKVRGKRINVLGRAVTEKFFALIRELRKTQRQNISQEIVFTLQEEPRFFVTTISFVKVNNLPRNIEQGVLIVLEDVTEVVKANKLRTWQEAALQMAHEIKNPLTPIQLATQRLQRRLGKTLCDDPVFFQCTDVILEQVALIKNLVTHFSEFATLPVMQCELANMQQIVQEVVSLYRISYPETTIITSFDENLPLVAVDIKRIKRVLVNLFDNSMRALLEGPHRKGDGKIIITLKKTDDDRWIELLFADTGPGIAQEVRDKLFLPYVSTEKKNMGLGLAIVHDIIMQHGGSIVLVPSDIGVVFRILLPMC